MSHASSSDRMDVDAGNNRADDDNESGSGSGSGDESSEEEVLQPKILPQRSTRGTRLTATSGEGDDEFWEQDFFAEEAEVEEYDKDAAAEDHESDEADDDFSEDEQQSDDDEVQADKEKKGKKQGAYQDPKHLAAKRAAAAKKAVATKAAARKATAAAIASAIVTGNKTQPSPVYDDDSGFPTGLMSDGTPVPEAATAAAAVVGQKRRTPVPNLAAFAGVGRKSHRQTTVESSVKTQHREAEHEKKRKEAKPKAKIVFRLLTQEEQLEQTKQTELENQHSLAQLLKIEELKKKEAAPKAKQLGPRIIWKSSVKQAPLIQLTFTSGAVPDFLSQRVMPLPSLQDLKCVISKQPAHYIDPFTRLPFASRKEFAQLRAKQPALIKLMQTEVEKQQQNQLIELQKKYLGAAPPALPHSLLQPVEREFAVASPIAAVAASAVSRKRKQSPDDEPSHASPAPHAKSSPPPATAVMPASGHVATAAASQQFLGAASMTPAAAAPKLNTAATVSAAAPGVEDSPKGQAKKKARVTKATPKPKK